VRRTQSGFTLLELLIVVVIIGIIVTFATLKIGNRALDDRLQVEAQRLDKILRFAAEQAEIKGIELGFRYTAQGYEFLVMGEDGKWLPYDGDPILRQRSLEDVFVIDLRVDGRAVPPAVDSKDKDKAMLPQVALLSSGELSQPFVLSLFARGLPDFWRLQSDVLERFTLERLPVKT
jgi:general secretion pathway protein H